MMKMKNALGSVIILHNFFSCVSHMIKVNLSKCVTCKLYTDMFSASGCRL